MALVICLSALALGGADVRVVLVGTFAMVGCGVLGMLDGSIRRVSAPALIMAGLGVYSLLQAVPLPLAWLKFMSPVAAEAWSRSLLPFGEQVGFGSLSLDPGASCVEGAKWLSYAVAFSLAAAISERRGVEFGVASVFTSSLLVALATLAHGLAGATRVYGLYEPQLGPASNHIGPFLNPNCLAGYLILGVLCGFGFVVSSKDLAIRCLWGAGTAIIAGTAVLSGSRGGVGALALATVAFALVTFNARRKRRQLHHLKWYDWGGALAVLLFAVGFAALGAQDDWFELTHGDLSKLRMGSWVLPMIRDFPAFGVGRGAFESTFQAYKPTADNIIYANPENILAQWASEWGVLMGVGGFSCLLWVLRPSRLGFGRRALVSSAVVGVAALVFQNFVDFGLELFAPMLAATVLLGSCWGNRRPGPSRGLHSVVLVSAAAVAVLLACAFGRSPVSLQRLALQAQLAQLNPKLPGATQQLWDQLRSAMERHPAEPYFPRLGAVVALRVGNVEPLPWIGRALERGPVDSRTHWLLARTLQRHGYLQQALLEARLAVEYDPDLAPTVGQNVAGWSEQFADIERAAPPGPSGSQVAISAASAIPPGSNDQLREGLFRLAVRKDKSFARAHKALAEELLRGLGSARCAADASAQCRADVLHEASALDRLNPSSADGSVIRAELYRATDQSGEADRVLSARCPVLEQSERVRCWQALLAVALARPGNRQLVERVARHVAKTACTLEKGCEAALLQAGEAMKQLENWPEALAYFQGAVQIDPTVPALLSVADAAIALGRPSVADRALQMAERQSRQNPTVRGQIQAKRDAIAIGRAGPVGPRANP